MFISCNSSGRTTQVNKTAFTSSNLNENFSLFPIDAVTVGCGMTVGIVVRI